MKVLVTGGFGYVGSRLTPHLLSLGHSVRVIDLMLYTSAGLDALKADPRFDAEWKTRFDLVRGDLRDPAAVAQAVQGMDAVVHLGAISNDPTGEIDDTLTRQVNFDAIGMLIAQAKKAGVCRVINGSSSSVFGARTESSITEVLEPEPLTSYSRYKMLSEWLLVAASSPDFVTVNIRPATICGWSPRQRFDLTVNKLTADAVRKRVITVHGGQQRRPNVGMTDIVRLYGLLLDADATLINGRTFNFGFENHKVIEIAELIKDVLSDLQVRIDVTSTTDHRDYHISSDKIQSVLGFKPESSIRQEVESLRAQLDEGFADIDAAEYYNMKFMDLGRNPGAYTFLSK